MAANISKVKCKEYAGVEVTYTALTTSYKTVDFTGVDENTLLLVNNSSTSAAATLTIKQGNGIAGVADLEIEVAAGKTLALQLNSQEFMSVTGEDKGCLNAKASAASTLSLAVVELL